MTASYFYAKIITFAIYLCIEKCIFEFFYLTSVLSFSLLCKRNWKSWWGKAKLNIGESLRTFLSKAVESYLFFYRLHQLEEKKMKKETKISKYRNKYYRRRIQEISVSYHWYRKNKIFFWSMCANSK
jgi:hypothetical protein